MANEIIDLKVGDGESVEEEEVEPEEEVLESAQEYEFSSQSLRPISDLEAKLNEAKRGKITLVEKFIIIPAAFFADIFEFISDLLIEIPILGQVLVIFAFIFGLIVSGIILLWSFSRGGKGNILIVRITTMLVAMIVDAGTIGFLPARTIGVIVAILLNDWLSERKIKAIQAEVNALTSSIRIRFES